MRRREFITLLLGMTAARPCGAVAQVRKRRPLVAFLSGVSAERGTGRETFVRRLQELGHTDGRDVDIVFRYADGDLTRVPALADELVQLKPDVVVAVSNVEARAVRQVTSQIPIVTGILFNANSPELGLIAVHARPEGNVTGILNNVDGLSGKILELTTEVVRSSLGRGKPDVPQATTKIGTLGVAGFQQSLIDLKLVRDAAVALGIEIFPVEVGGPDDLEGAFQTLARERVHAVQVFGHQMLFTERQRIATLAIEVRLPTIYTFRPHVEAGGLMSYGVDLRASFRRVADFVDKIILKEAMISDLPVELPMFQLVVNLKTAKTLGLVIPPSLLVRADEVIE